MVDENLTKNVQDEFILVNIVEEMVTQKVNELIKDMGMCSCEKCKMNACAIALNNLPPHYVTTTRGELLVKLLSTEVNYQMNIMVEVMKALMVVKKQPLH